MLKKTIFIRYFSILFIILLYLFIVLIIDHYSDSRFSSIDTTLMLAPLILILAITLAIISVKKELLEHEIKNNLDELKQAYIIDKLTGLPNRMQLLQAQKYTNKSSLILINIDRFKEINEIYGITTGDKVICAVAQEIFNWSSDKPLTVYKVHSDEFALLLNPQIHDESPSDKTLTQNIISHWVTDLLSQLRNNQIIIEGQSIQITASAGIVVDSSHPNTEADRALRKAKSELKEYYIYNDTLSIENNYLNNRKMLEKIKKALASNNIKTYFQPISNPHETAISKYESLVRLHTDDGQVITPFFFIGIARKAKLYPELTRIMFDHVVDILVLRADLTISINISFDDIANKNTRDYIHMKIAGLKPKGKLILEILESDEINNFDTIQDFMVKLTRFGVEFAIDDFGSGFSNYSRLARLPIRYLKIDGSLIRDMLENDKHRIIVQSIIDSAHQLGYLSIAEFVENEALAKALIDMKVDYLQGYYLGKPEIYDFTKQDSLPEPETSES